MSESSVVVGELAPEFTLDDQNGEQVSLSSLRDGKSVLIVFYPFAFSGLCTGELCAIRDDIAEYQNDHVQVVGISCDPKYTLRAWADDQGYTFPLLSDFWPHGAVAEQYGVFLPARGMATRGSFLVDREGVLRWAVVNGPGEARDLGAYRSALAEV